MRNVTQAYRPVPVPGPVPVPVPDNEVTFGLHCILAAPWLDVTARGALQSRNQTQSRDKGEQIGLLRSMAYGCMALEG